MNTKVSVKEKICYGIGSGGGNIITQILGTFLTAYYTDSVGIAAAAVGTMMLVARLLDGISDVMMGGIVDKTRTKWGKARPWILISAPVICIGLILTFNVPGSLSSSAKLIYAYITYVFLNCIAFTAYMISHTALLSRVTLDVNDRQSMTSINQIVNNIVQLIVTGFTIKFVTAAGWRSVSIVYGLLTALMLLICFWGVREHLDMDAETEEVKVETVPVIIGNCFVPAIVKKMGHQKTLILSSILMLAGFLIVAINPYSGTLAIVGTVVRGFGNGAIFACGFALSAQVVDYGEWKFNVRSEGLVNSCVSFGQKVGLGLGAAIASWIIAAGGYVGTAKVQTASANSAIIFAYVWFGVILAALLLVVSLFLNIDKYEGQIKKDLEQRHKA